MVVVGVLKNREAKKSEIPKKGKTVHTSILYKKPDSWDRPIKGKRGERQYLTLKQQQQQQQKGQVKEEGVSEKCTYSGVQMGISPAVTIYDNQHGNGSKSNISTRPSYFSIEELPSTLEEGFRFRPSHPRDEEEGDEENEDYNDDDHDNDTVRRGNGKWKPGVKEWLVLICVSIVVMMDAFDATVIIPLVSVCKYIFFSLFGHLLLIECEFEVKKYHCVLASIPYLQQTSREHPMAGHGVPPIQRRRPGYLRHAH